MQNYTGMRKTLKEAGYNRRDRAGEELWMAPGSDRLMQYDSAVKHYKRNHPSEENDEAT